MDEKEVNVRYGGASASAASGSVEASASSGHVEASAAEGAVEAKVSPGEFSASVASSVPEGKYPSLIRVVLDRADLRRRLRAKFRYVPQAVSASETVGFSVSLSFSDFVAFSDVLDAVLSVGGKDLDSVSSVSESVSKALGKVREDALGSAELVRMWPRTSVSDLASSGEEISWGLGKSVLESAQASEQLDFLASYNRSIEEAASAGDAVSKWLGTSAGDSAGALDWAVLDFGKSQLDAVGSQEELSWDVSVLLLESVLAYDLANLQKSSLGSLDSSDASSLAELISFWFGTSASDSASAHEDVLLALSMPRDVESRAQAAEQLYMTVSLAAGSSVPSREEILLHCGKSYADELPTAEYVAFYASVFSEDQQQVSEDVSKHVGTAASDDAYAADQVGFHSDARRDSQVSGLDSAEMHAGKVLEDAPSAAEQAEMSVDKALEHGVSSVSELSFAVALAVHDALAVYEQFESMAGGPDELNPQDLLSVLDSLSSAAGSSASDSGSVVESLHVAVGRSESDLAPLAEAIEMAFGKYFEEYAQASDWAVLHVGKPSDSAVSSSDHSWLSVGKYFHDLAGQQEWLESAFSKALQDQAPLSEYVSWHAGSALHDAASLQEALSKSVGFFASDLGSASDAVQKLFFSSRLSQSQAADSAVFHPGKSAGDSVPSYESGTIYMQDYIAWDYIEPGYYGTIQNF